MIAVFLTLALGFWFGARRLGSFSLGSVTSTLIAGLLVGQLHIPIAPLLQETFFMMFLFAVGYDVGPQFFRALKQEGLPQVAFTLIVCASGLLTAYALARVLGYNAGLAAGLLAGGYTDSGTLGVDVLTLLGARQDIEDIVRVLGYADRATSGSDIAFMAAGIVVGSLVGAVTIHVGGIPLSLSPSVGALLAGLVCGYLRSVYRTFGRIPAPALWVFNNVGLNGFIAVVGLNAAPGLVTGLATYGIGLFLAGIIVSMVPLAVGLYAGKFIFKFHPAILLGAIAGARTTTAALGAIQEAARSTLPAIGYTIPYAVGRIVLAVCGLIVVLLMK